MLEPFRTEFNSSFTDNSYARLLAQVTANAVDPPGFRICETPCFFPKALLEEMAAVGQELTFALTTSVEYMDISHRAVPDRYRVPNENAQPNFMTVDFGFVRERNGRIGFKLVEMQAFPSLYGYQDVLSRQYVETYGLSPELGWHLGSHDSESYWSLLRRVIVGRYDPVNVVLLEVTPERQKTRADFRVYEQKLGIATVDIASVRKEGSKLYYSKGDQWIPIDRIFNRAIVDEMAREGVTPGFDHRDDIEVEWAGHPNWYFRASKFSLPYLTHPSVPAAVFLDDWFRGIGPDRLPCNPRERLLKPLYSFAGKGIQFAPTDAELAAIPEAQRHLFLLQERVHFEPVIRTPYGSTQAEVRVMYLWPDGGDLEPVISLVRLGRGLMMGVDHNREQKWVGSSAALHPKG